MTNAIDYHNHRTLNSTGFKPIELRNNYDEIIVKEVVNNIIKSMIRKIKKFEYCNPNSLLLISPNIHLKGNKFVFIKNKKKNSFIIPGILVQYINDDTIEVTIKVDYYDSLNKDKSINILIDCWRLIDDFGLTLYLNKYGEIISNDNLKKLVLFKTFDYDNI